MTYKESIDLFRNQYDDICFARNIKGKGFTKLEIFTRLSQVQAELSNQYRLYELVSNISVVAGTREYALETVLPNCLNVIKITYEDIHLEKCSYDEITEIEAESGQPTKFTIYGIGTARKLKFDFTPDESGTYTAYYYARLNPQGTYAMPTGTASGVYDETASGYGGSWKIPEEYHPLIVEGAIAKIFPDMFAIYYQNVRELIKRKQIVFRKVGGFLGI